MINYVTVQINMESSRGIIKTATDIPQLLTNREFYLGLSLAVFSSVFIGSSFIIKKISLQRLGKTGNIRAGSGGFGYLKDWLWWLGLITMGIGELSNFAAYAFAPASLVTPLGALSVLVSALLAEKILNENLKVWGKVGCALCIFGSTIMVICAPKEQQAESLEEFFQSVQNAAFVHYVVIVLIIAAVVIIFAGPKYGSRYVSVYITLCSAIGSLTVMACKGLGLAIKNHFTDSSQKDFWSIWLILILLSVVIICILIQMNYLNKALDLFSINVVTPIYYVMFTTLVIVASAILFKEWKTMDQLNILGAIFGFFIVVIAVILLNGQKENEIRYTGPLIKTHTNSYGSNIFA